MESILNAGLGIGVLMFLLLLFKKPKKSEDYLFLSWIVITLLQIVFSLITIYYFELKGIWAILGFGLPLLGAPLLFIYILILTGHSISWKTFIGHLCVYPIYVLLLLIFQETYSMEIVASNGFLDLSDSSNIWTNYYAIPMAISGLIYFIWNLTLLRTHREKIVNLFSFKERINLKWLDYIVYSYLILFVLASFLIFGSIHFQLFSMKSAFALVGILLCLMLLVFGFYGFRQTAIFSNREMAKPIAPSGISKASYAKSGLDEERIKDLAKTLSNHMETTSPYLNEDLNLKNLSAECGIQQTHISQVINQHFKMNFYDFINQYRIEETKKRLSSSDFDHLSVLGIAFECGFKSKSSFNRYFKKYTGVSPSEFKKKQTK
ncbi:AraC family transcriptional regulator [Maribacter algarum]|uniref:AraC family transcriptional regulator n=1 Tax=Maribacter algarum (ex Zhang et al. 2020) TaxID=2578118 RepID=A0A5S3PVB3_9FLAO|nr:helix-turn-helix domain-containing protein [Maribacter algarum]TMM58848.1 AraC family transcriptional regulator [Maribacter algarum]